MDHFSIPKGYLVRLHTQPPQESFIIQHIPLGKSGAKLEGLASNSSPNNLAEIYPPTRPQKLILYIGEIRLMRMQT